MKLLKNIRDVLRGGVRPPGPDNDDDNNDDNDDNNDDNNGDNNDDNDNDKFSEYQEEIDNNKKN